MKRTYYTYSAVIILVVCSLTLMGCVSQTTAPVTPTPTDTPVAPTINETSSEPYVDKEVLEYLFTEGTMRSLTAPIINETTQTSNFQKSGPIFTWGDVIEDLMGNRYVIYNENMETSGNYLVYDVSSCPTEKKLILKVQDVDSAYEKVDHINPSLACSVLANPSTSCGIIGKWEPKTSNNDPVSVYLKITPDNKIQVYQFVSHQSELLKISGTYEVTAPNTLSVEWDGGFSEIIKISSDCTMSSTAFRSSSNFVRVDE